MMFVLNDCLIFVDFQRQINQWTMVGFRLHRVIQPMWLHSEDWAAQ